MSASQSELKDEITVLTCAVAALGIGQKRLVNVSRMALNRATRGKTRQLTSLHRTRQALLDLVLRYFRANALAGSGGANAFADAMLMFTLRLYPQVRNELIGARPLTALDVRLLIEEVLVPTAFAIMSTSRLNGVGFEVRGLGDEFRGPKSWYLPEGDRPLNTILDRWLRVAGFRTPCGFSRDSANLKKQVSRWLQGKTRPSIEDLDGLVDRYRDRVEWLDDANGWKARFRLARALQSLWVSAEEYFASHHDSPPTSVRKLFAKINGEEILRDADGLLGDPEIFFAVRLVQLKLKREGKFEKAVMPPQASYRRAFSPAASCAEIEQYQIRIARRLNIGNRLVRYLARRGHIRLGSVLARPSLQATQRIKEYIFSLGLDELRRMRKEGRLTY